MALGLALGIKARTSYMPAKGSFTDLQPQPCLQPSKPHTYTWIRIHNHVVFTQLPNTQVCSLGFTTPLADAVCYRVDGSFFLSYRQLLFSIWVYGTLCFMCSWGRVEVWESGGGLYLLLPYTRNCFNSSDNLCHKETRLLSNFRVRVCISLTAQE